MQRQMQERRCSRRNEEDPWKANSWREVDFSWPAVVMPIYCRYVTSGEAPWKSKVVVVVVVVVRGSGRDTSRAIAEAVPRAVGILL